MLSTTFSLKAHDNDNSGCCFIGEDAEAQTVGDTAGGEAGSRTCPGSKSTICLLAMLLPRHQGALSTTLSRH